MSPNPYDIRLAQLERDLKSGKLSAGAALAEAFTLGGQLGAEQVIEHFAEYIERHPPVGEPIE